MHFKRATLLIAVIASSVAIAQLGGRQIPGLKVPGLDDPFKKEPITTSLKDAKWEDKTKDGFTPREATRSIMTLQRTPNGGFVLQPGSYQAALQSY